MEDTTSTDLVETAGTGAGVHEGIAVDAEGNALTQEQVQSLAQPEPTTDAAETETVDNSTEQAQVETTKVDPDLIEWAKKKGGFDLAEEPSAREIRALEIARNTEQEFHARNQQQSDLKRQMDTARQYQSYQQPYQQPPAQQPQYDEYGYPVQQQPAPVQPQSMPQMPQIDPSLELLKFQVNHKDYEQGSTLDSEMGRVVSEDPFFWATRLDQAYSIAKANLSSSDVESRIEAARSEERARLTRNSALSQPNAQSTAPVAVATISTAAQAESFINSASKEDYNAKLPELEKALGIELRPRK